MIWAALYPCYPKLLLIGKCKNKFVGMVIIIFFLSLRYGCHLQQMCLIRALFSAVQARAMAVVAEQFIKVTGYQKSQWAAGPTLIIKVLHIYDYGYYMCMTNVGISLHLKLFHTGCIHNANLVNVSALILTISLSFSLSLCVCVRERKRDIWLILAQTYEADFVYHCWVIWQHY